MKKIRVNKNLNVFDLGSVLCIILGKYLLRG